MTLEKDEAIFCLDEFRHSYRDEFWRAYAIAKSKKAVEETYESDPHFFMWKRIDTFGPTTKYDPRRNLTEVHDKVKQNTRSVTSFGYKIKKIN